MTVKELMERLAYCNPNAIVCVEAWSDTAANEVGEYIIDNTPYVYIGDTLENLEYELELHNEEE